MFVQFHLDSDVMQTALEAAPEMRVTVKNVDSAPEIPHRSVFWARDGDFDAFDDGLAADDTVERFRPIAENDGERLYCAHHHDDLPDIDVRNAGVHADGVLLRCETTGGGWTVKMLFPDRESFTTFREACADAGLTVDVDSIYSKPFSEPSNEFALTDPQRDLLERAVEVGYFDIPRETTLQELGQQMDISGQAASERLRRGMETLIRETVTNDALESDQRETDM